MRSTRGLRSTRSDLGGGQPPFWFYRFFADERAYNAYLANLKVNPINKRLAKLVTPDLLRQVGCTNAQSTAYLPTRIMQQDGTLGYAASNELPYSAGPYSNWTTGGTASDLGAGNAIAGKQTRRFASTGGVNHGFYKSAGNLMAGSPFIIAHYVARVSGAGSFRGGTDSGGRSLMNFVPETGLFNSGPATKGAVAVAGGWIIWGLYTGTGGGVNACVFGGSISDQFDVATFVYYGSSLQDYVPTGSSRAYGVPIAFDRGATQNGVRSSHDLSSATWAQGNASISVSAGSIGQVLTSTAATTNNIRTSDQITGTRYKSIKVRLVGVGAASEATIGYYTTSFVATTATILSGPGVLNSNGGSWGITGLLSGVVTTVLLMTTAAVPQGDIYIYVGTHTQQSSASGLTLGVDGVGVAPGTGDFTLLRTNGASGVLYTAGTPKSQNLVPTSDAFDGSGWTKQLNVNVTATNSADPVGGNAAYTIDWTNASNGTGIYASSSNWSTLVAGCAYTTGFWLQAVSGSGNVDLSDAYEGGTTTVAITSSWTWCPARYVASGGRLQPRVNKRADSPSSIRIFRGFVYEGREDLSISAIPQTTGTVTSTYYQKAIERWPAATNLLLNSATVAAQTVSGLTQGAPYTFSWYGQGSPVTEGPLYGTQTGRTDAGRTTTTFTVPTATLADASTLVTLGFSDANGPLITSTNKQGILTNCVHENRLSNAKTITGWGVYGGVTPAATSVLAPDGSMDGVLLDDQSAAAYSGYNTGTGSNAAGTYTFSIWVQAGSSAGFSLWVYGPTTTVWYFQDELTWSSGVPSGSGWSVVESSGTWFRIAKTFTTGGTTPLQVYILPARLGVGYTGSTAFFVPQINLGTSAAPTLKSSGSAIVAPVVAFDRGATLNAALSSDDLSTTWTAGGGGCSVASVPGKTLAFYGYTLTAQKLTPAAGLAQHYRTQNVAAVSGGGTGQRFVQVLAQAGEWPGIAIYATASAATGQVFVDLTTGTVKSSTAGASSISVTPAGGGVWLISFAVTNSTATSNVIEVHPASQSMLDSGGFSATGDGSSGVYVYRVGFGVDQAAIRLKAGAVLAYTAGTPRSQNLIPNSSNLVGWGMSGVTPTLLAGQGPTGQNAFRLTKDDALGSRSLWAALNTLPTVSGTAYTVIWKIRAGTLSAADFGILGSVSWPAGSVSDIVSGPGSINAGGLAGVSGLSSSQWTVVRSRIVLNGTAVSANLYPGGSGAGNSGGYVDVCEPQLYEGWGSLSYTSTVGVPYSEYPMLGVVHAAAATNLLTYSEQFDNAAWGKSRATISANQAVAPNGTSTADKLVFTSAAGTHRIYLQVSKAASAITYTLSVYAKKADASPYDDIRLALSDATESNSSYCTYNLSTGLISTPTNVGFTSAVAGGSAVGGGWYRFQLTATSNTDTTIGSFIGSSSYSAGDDASGFYIWGAQLETGSIATPYIATTSASASRSATLVRPPTSYIADAGQLTLWEGVVTSAASGNTQRLLNRAGGIVSYIHASGYADIYDGTTAVATANTTSSGVPTRISSIYSGSSLKISMNGGAVASGLFDGTMGTSASTVCLGDDGSGGEALNGISYRLAIGPTIPTDANLQRASNGLGFDLGLTTNLFFNEDAYNAWLTSATSLQILSVTGTATNGQLEAGTVATPPILTVSASATRGATLLRLPSDHLLDGGQTTFIECTPARVATGTTQVLLGRSPAASADPAYLNASGTYAGIYDGTYSATSAVGSVLAGVSSRIATTYSSAGLAISVNGATPITASYDGGMGTSASTIALGDDNTGANEFAGQISQFGQGPSSTTSTLQSVALGDV